MLFKKTKICFITFFSFIALTGCSTVINGTKQSISLETPPAKDARCNLTNNKGKWYVSSTPGSVVVHRSNKPLIVNCEKEGYKTTTQTVHSEAKAAVAGNILLGGIVGAGVDMADGAAFRYPNLISVPMQKEVGTSSKSFHYKKHKK